MFKSVYNMLESYKLPTAIPLEEGAKTYSSRYSIDLMDLIHDIQSLNKQDRTFLIAATFVVGTIKPPLLLRIAFKRYKSSLMKHQGGVPDDFLAWQQFFLGGKPNRLVDDAIRTMCNHILKGHDREEQRSVGGWSQREINFASNVLTYFKRRDEQNQISEMSRD